jgi:glucose-6-phosphate dehydrogenase assembly protein OpcA
VSDTLHSLVAGGRHPVEVGAIESELAALWRGAALGEPGDHGEAVTRACLWNLVAHSPDAGSADALQAELTRLSMELPARVVLVRTDSAAPEDHVDAWIAANCHLGEGGRGHVCTEEIIVAASGSAGSSLPALVRSLLAPDVPSALLWSDPPSRAGHQLSAWLGMTDRFIFDSATVGSGPGLGALLAEAGAQARPPVLGDLHWRRQRPWRLLTARAYGRPALQAMILAAECLELHGAPPALDSAAALFLGWFLTRLRLAVRPGGYAGADGREVRVDLHPSDGEVVAGGLTAVVFRGPAGALEMARRGELLVARLVDCVHPGPELREPAPRPGLAVALAAELDDDTGDPLLAAALPAAVTLWT